MKDKLSLHQRYFVSVGEWPARPLHEWVERECHREIILTTADITDNFNLTVFTVRDLEQLNDDIVEFDTSEG